MPNYFHFKVPDDGIDFNRQLETQQCTFIKTDGHRCKLNVVFGQPLCFIHRKKEYHVALKPSTIPNAGKGLFADNGTNDNSVVFRAGRKICPYYGETLTPNQIDNRYGVNKTVPYAVEIKNDGTSLDGAIKRGIGSMINHKPISQANTRFSINRPQTEINIVATKNIKNKRELYVPYGSEYKFNEVGLFTATNMKKYNI
jgi:hypothetical protein